MTQRLKAEIGRLLEQVARLADGPEQQAVAAHWQRYRSRVPSDRDESGPLFTLDVGIPTWSRVLGFDITAYNTNTLEHVRNDLRIRLEHQRRFHDDTLVGKALSAPSFAGNLECSMLGAQIVFRSDTNPWAVTPGALVATEADVAGLEMPDFHTAGEMPRVHRMWQETRELVQELGFGDWPVQFPQPIRGVLGLAQTMRGSYANLTLDMLDRPEFAAKLFRFAADFRFHYARELARVTGKPIGRGNLNNDEVNTPSISPSLYAQFLLPLEAEISRFHGGLALWHSCGDTSALVPLIRQIPDIGWFYTGPWTRLDAVMAAFGDSVPIDIALNVVDDVLAASPGEMEAGIRRVVEGCAGAALKLRAGCVDSAFELQADLAQCARWCDVARRVLRR